VSVGVRASLSHADPLVSTETLVLGASRSYTAPMPDPAPRFAIRDNFEKHRFEADLGDGSIAIAEYTLSAGKIMFTHTEVPEAHEGQGIGSALIRFALHSARERGLKVIPICPFFAAYIRNHPGEQDLLDPAWRIKLGLSPI
jgi:predicted GNAT family acetyltransferase